MKTIRPQESALVPRKMKGFVKFGAYDDLETIVKSQVFLPTFISGLSRAGKTVMVEQVCANLGREMMRVNFSEETDEEGLIGGFRLSESENGVTITTWMDGPVVTAMRNGNVLLLDEIDKATHKCMCLQPILEGSPVYIKKTGEMIYPKAGFNIIATANTKGQGDLTGKFLSAQSLDEAFLDRFSITIEHNYPPEGVEKQIISFHLDGQTVTAVDSRFIDDLVIWANNIRKNYMEERTTDLISTGRLIHIVKTYRVFRCPFKAVRYGISRFDESMQGVFWEMFTKYFPYQEGDLSPVTGKVTGTNFIKRMAEGMDLSEFNTKYRVGPFKNK